MSIDKKREEEANFIINAIKARKEIKIKREMESKKNNTKNIKIDIGSPRKMAVHISKMGRINK